MSAPVRLLTIAGSDSGGGAGIQADLKTFQAFGCFGMSAITAVTAQNTRGVYHIQALHPEVVEEQITRVLDDIGADAIKIGMLHSEAIMETVARCLDRFENSRIVLDPVMVAKGGCPLLESRGVESLKQYVFPRIKLLTPNLPEAEALVGFPIHSRTEMEEAASKLLEAVPALVLKGGHFSDSRCSPDFYADRSGIRKWIEFPRIETPHTHGTGCTYSAAIAAAWALEGDAFRAVLRARTYLQSAIEAGALWRLGQGKGPVDHGFERKRHAH